jgi:predicted AlkP superfamily pyrophosphatase or phosphodiesterase
MIRRWTILAAAVAGLAPSLASAQAPADGREQIDLVVVITVDQLRGDYMERFAPNLTGGLKRFREQGAYFPAAEQDHANTSTAPGHSTILSGRVPASTNILSNDLGVPDPAHRLIGGATGPGASPFRFRGSTLYDWMRAVDSDVRVLSVARKDRGAILPIGTAMGHVFWWSNDRFTHSTWYGSQLPAWVDEWNAAFDAEAWPGRQWTLLLPETAYPEPDDQPYEGTVGGRGNVFPHTLSTVASLVNFPWMDSLTVDMALHGARSLELGRRGSTDLLAVGMSTLDAIGHHFGPESREVHDMVVRVDRWLGLLMTELEKDIPAQRILYVLTSDHGVQSMPEIRRHFGADDVGRLAIGPAARPLLAPLQDRFSHRFGVQVQNSVLVADTAALRARGVDVVALQRDVARAVAQVPGIARVWTPETLDAAPDDDASARLWRRAIPPSYGWLVAGEVRPGWLGTTSIQATHGSPVPDDRSVPVAFLGSGIAPQRYDHVIATVDIAPTLAALLGIEPTEPLDGEVLPQIVRAGGR